MAKIKGQKPLTCAERQEIARRYEAGETIEGLMAEYHRAKPTIKRVIRDEGGIIRPRGYGKNREWTPEWRAAHKASCSTLEFAEKSRDGLLKRLPSMRGPATNTPIERRMQDALKVAGIGFTTQVPMLRRYLVDILLHQAPIVIEADGAQHSLRDRKAKDAERDAALTNAGYRVFRFTGSEINADALKCVRHVIDACGLTPDEDPVYNINLAPLRGPSHPRWKGGKREFACEACGIKFLAQPKHRRGRHVFCSRQCAGTGRPGLGVRRGRQAAPGQAALW
jgi:very-short-patch-repair endonuclease